MKAYINPEKITENDKIHLKQYRIDPSKEYVHFITYDVHAVAELFWKRLSKKEIHESIIKNCIFLVWERKGYYFDNIDHFFDRAVKYANEVLKMIEECEEAGFDFKQFWEDLHEEEIEIERQKLLAAISKITSKSDNTVERKGRATLP